MQTFDAIVLGTGGVGSAALYHLAARGVRALGLDRFAPGHDRGSSHGHTRIIRQAYFEHPDYVPMVLRSYELWRALEEQRGEQLYFPVGLLQIGTEQGVVLPGLRRSAAAHALELEDLSSAELRRRFPALHVPEPLESVFERRAGYLLVERCVIAHAEEALRLGAQLHSGETVVAWRAMGNSIVVKTDRDRYVAERLVIAAGAWAKELLGDLQIPLQIRRKEVYWSRPQGEAFSAQCGCPAFLYELPKGVFYGLPQVDDRGVKVAEHSGGRIVSDPLAINRDIDPLEQARVADFCRRYLPTLTPEWTAHSVCMYTMTPDEHFIVDRHPQYANVVFVAGLSGHGFKFAPALGEAASQLLLDGSTTAEIGFLSYKRPALARVRAAVD